MQMRLMASIATLALVSISAGASAHHAFSSVFDPERPLNVMGTVTAVEWTNPHVWFYIDVTNDDGSVENWGFEMGSVNTLVRRGWAYDSLRIGETVHVRGVRARDGTPRGAVREVALASGERLFGGQNESR